MCVSFHSDILGTSDPVIARDKTPSPMMLSSALLVLGRVLGTS